MVNSVQSIAAETVGLIETAKLSIPKSFLKKSEYQLN